MAESEEKGEMLGGNIHEFFVVNLKAEPIAGTVYWKSGSNSIGLSVEGLAPAAISYKLQFYPESGNRDYWHWSEEGRDYQLNIYDGDRYTIVTLSDYGICVVPTHSAPDTWKF